MTTNDGFEALQTSSATVYGQVKWPTLKTATEASAALGIEEHRLLDLANAGFAPHWRIDGGPPQFMIGELKEWARRELLQQFEGKPLPTEIRIVYEAGQANHHSVPKAIQDIEGLRDATELLQLRSGIYFLCELGQVVYIGQSVSAASRVSSHRQNKDFDRIFFLPWPKFDLDRIEAAFIKTLRPPLNGTHAKSEPTDDERNLVASMLAHVPVHVCAGDGEQRKEND